jgi:hypothetical protein
VAFEILMHSQLNEPYVQPFLLTAGAVFLKVKICVSIIAEVHSTSIKYFDIKIFSVKHGPLHAA